MNTQDTYRNQHQPSGDLSSRQSELSRRTEDLRNSYSQPLPQQAEPAQEPPLRHSQQFKSRFILVVKSGASESSSPPSVPITPPRTGLLSWHRAQQMAQAIPSSQLGQSVESPGSNTMQLMRGWSGRMAAISNKLAAMAGHRVQPP